MTQINYPTKQQWVEALRSGEYKQGISRLKDGCAFCALGVYMDLLVKSNQGEWVTRGVEMVKIPQIDEPIASAFVPIGTLEFGRILELNDGKKLGFDAIADYIETDVEVYPSLMDMWAEDDGDYCEQV